MSINRICPSCKATFKLQTLLCHHCKVNLTKFKVRIRTAQGWKTLQTENLKEAQRFNSGLPLSQPPRHTKSSPQESPHALPPVTLGCTLQEVFDHFITWAETHKRSWKSDKQLFELRLAPLKFLPLSLITPEIVQQHIDSLKPARKEGGHLAPATKLQVSAFIRRLFNFARKRRMWTGENPVSFIEFEKFDNSRTQRLDSTGVNRLLDALSSHENKRMALIIRAALWTGRRVGELKSLTWECVDLERRLVTPLRTKSGRKQTFVLNSKALEVFTEANSEHISELVFPNSAGKVFGNLDACWARFRVSHGFPGLWIHDLRRTAITLWAEAGLSPQQIMALSGHETLQVMMRYTRIGTEAQLMASERICAGFTPGPGPKQRSVVEGGTPIGGGV
jgi:integrase